MTDAWTEDENDNPPEGLVHVLHKDRLYSFDRAKRRRFQWSYFGGPLDGEIAGKSFGPKPLHHIATIYAKDVEADNEFGLIPLVYGMCYDSCDLVYEFSFDGIQIMHLEPCTSHESWPYSNYPMLLPYFDLEMIYDQPCDWTRFEALFINQPSSQPADMVVVIPPPHSIGMSLWGRDGDLEGVELVFECDLEKNVIKATNKCT